MFTRDKKWYKLATKTNKQLLEELKEGSDLLNHIIEGHEATAEKKYNQWRSKLPSTCFLLAMNHYENDVSMG